MQVVNSLKIALVDDEKELLSVYSNALEKLGYPTPLIFTNGTSLIRALMNDSEALYLILMDYRMPEMNGIEAAKILKRYRPQTRVVIMSAYDFVEEKADDLGLSFLRKPFSLEQLFQFLSILEN
jgi:CheY-like chemotaxis protein